MRQFKVRIEFKNATNFHAIEAWMQCDNIIAAGEMIMIYFAPLGITGENITKLIDITPDNPKEWVCGMGHLLDQNGNHVNSRDAKIYHRP